MAAEILCLIGLAALALGWRRRSDACVHRLALIATLAAFSEAVLALTLGPDWWRAGRYAVAFLAVAVFAQAYAVVRAQPPFAAPKG